MQEIINAIHPIASKLITCAVYIGAAVLIYFILEHFILSFFNHSRKRLSAHQAQRFDTIRSMILSVVKYIVMIGVVLAILATFGVNVSSILAGLGIATVLLGLAFQDIAKDVIAGFTIIAESQYEVGDVIEVNGFKGTVSSVGLKTTRIRDYHGKELIISNSNMGQLINYSVNNSLAEVTVQVDASAKVEAVEAALQQVCANIRRRKLPEVVGEVQYLGPVNTDDNGASWQVTAVCAPAQNQIPELEIRKEIEQQFAAARIKTPSTRVVVQK